MIHLEGILNPATESLANHLPVSSDGAIQGLTEAGVELIKVCQLDRARLVEFRRGIFQLLQMIEAKFAPTPRSISHKLT